jgi:hypothetical protein
MPPKAPASTQERAYTSPICYTPYSILVPALDPR